METKANYVAVGIFVLACVLGFVIALLWLAGAQYAQEYAYYKTVFTGGVTGLGTGTVVRYNGIDVGHVNKLSFDPDDPKKVIVTLQVDPTLRIHEDSEASIASEGLTGGSYVEIDGGSKNAPVLKPSSWGEYPTIRSKPSTLQQLEQSAPQLVAKLNKIADRLNDVLSDQNRQSIAQLLSNLRDTSATLARNSGNIDKILGNVAMASGKLDSDLGDVHGVLGDAHVLLANVDVTADKLDRLADDADTEVNDARLGQLTGQARDLVRSLTHLSNQLEREPTSLIFGDRRKGYTPQ